MSRTPVRGTAARSNTATHTLRPLAEQADRIGVHPRTLRRMIARGEVPAYRVGGMIRIDPAELDAAIHRIPAAGGAA